MNDPILLPARTQTAIDRMRYEGMGAIELWDELAVALGDLASQFERFAVIVTVLERKGEDVTRFKVGLGTYLPLIAAGAVAAEAVVKFAGQKMLLDAVTALPPEQQREIAKGQPLLVVERQGTEFTHRLLPAHCLNAEQVRQVFDTGSRYVRGEAEQINYLTPRQLPAKVRNSPRVKVDRRKGLVSIGSATAPIEDVVDALRKAKAI